MNKLLTLLMYAARKHGCLHRKKFFEFSLFKMCYLRKVKKAISSPKMPKNGLSRGSQDSGHATSEEAGDKVRETD